MDVRHRVSSKEKIPKINNDDESMSDISKSPTHSSSSNPSNSSSDELQQLTQDLNALDQQEKEASRMLIYKNNKIIFLIQSTLLGISYSIIWPTLWTYIRDDFVVSDTLRKLMYGITYVAYPLGSMFSARLVEKTNLTTKRMVLLLNWFEIIGNMVFTLNYLPFLPAIGRFTAGLGDAFYVVLMKEMKCRDGAPDERMTIECLAAFIIGVVLSPGLNILSTFMHFKLGTWDMNANKFPGLTVSVLFLIMQFIILVFLKENKEIKDDFVPCNEKSYQTRFIEVTNIIKDIPYTTCYVNIYAFIYTYIVALFELLIPIIIYEKLNVDTIGVMLLYAIIGTVYAMFLMMTMTVTFDYQPETFVCISVLVELIGLFSVLYFTWLSKNKVFLDVLAMVGIVFGLTAMWSNDDVLFINFVQMFIPFHQRETTHNTRKFMSKLAFGIAGLTVPLLYGTAMLFVAPILITLVCLMFVLFILIKFAVTKTGT